MINASNKKSQTLFSIWDYSTCTFSFCRAYGNRTRDSSVKGRCLNPLTNAPFVFGSAKIGANRISAKYF